MGETNTNENREEAAKATTEKKFTQEEVDRIVAARVAREAEKVQQLTVAVENSKANSETFEALATDSVKAVSELQAKVEKLEKDKIKYAVALETGIDGDLIDSFKWSTEEELRGLVEKWKPVLGASKSFTGKTYQEETSPTAIANNIIKKYRK